MGCSRDTMQSSQFLCCSGLSYKWISSGPMTEDRIFGSLALNASLGLPPLPGSLAVTPTFPLVTKIQPSSPSNFTPLGLSPPIYMVTPLAYLACTLKSPCTVQRPEVGNWAFPSNSIGPVYSVPMPQCPISI